MPAVNCGLKLCENNIGGICQAESITLSLANIWLTDAGCSDFRDVTVANDYREQFYKLCFLKYDDDRDYTGSSQYYKVVAYGKRILYDNLVLYAEGDYRDSETLLTEEGSGILVCAVGDLSDSAVMVGVRKRLLDIVSKFNYMPVAAYPDCPEYCDDSDCFACD